LKKTSRLQIRSAPNVASGKHFSVHRLISGRKSAKMFLLSPEKKVDGRKENWYISDG